MYKMIQRELKRFKAKAFRWTSTETKTVELVGVGGDQPEMRKLANQTTLGYRSCVYSLVCGSWLVVDNY